MRNYRTHGRTIFRTFVLVLSVCLPAQARAADYGSHAVVSTVAGDGRIGVAGGAALQTHFVLPVGVSIGTDGSTLIVDAGANAVYRLRDGSIARVAGVVGRIDARTGAAGGYADGTTASALFDRPSAAVEMRGRGIFVADSGNHCIRSIVQGRVTTFAGSQTSGANDGPARTATFAHPVGLALAPDGALLVADYGNGIRHIAPDGSVTTLSYGTKTILGIAAANVNGHDIVAFTDRDAIHLVVDGKDQSVAASDGRMPTKEGVPIFHGWGIAILNENTVVVSDVLTSVIRLIRFPALPYVAEVASLALSGTLHEDTDFHGGFRDGTASEALYHEPRGIALDPTGRLVIADAGNRRIRLLEGIDSRESALPDLSNFSLDPGAHNIVMIGQSTLFNGSLWSDSVPAAAQGAFARLAATDGIGRPVRIQAIRADGVTLEAMFELTDNYVAERDRVDTVAFFFPLFALPSPEDLVLEANKLAANNIKTIVYLVPERSAVSLGEYPYNACGCVVDASDIEAVDAIFARNLAQFRAAGIQAESFEPAIANALSQAVPVPIYDAADPHFTPAGQRLLGESFARSLVADRRWLAAKAPIFPDLFTKPNPCPALPVDTTLPSGGGIDPFTTGGVRPSDAKVIANGDRLERTDTIYFRGWAFVAAMPIPDRRVCPVIDGSTGLAIRGDEDIDRPDVALVFHTAAAELSGFELQLDVKTIAPGPHRIGMAVILGDGKAYPIGTPVDVVVQ